MGPEIQQWTEAAQTTVPSVQSLRRTSVRIDIKIWHGNVSACPSDYAVTGWIRNTSSRVFFKPRGINGIEAKKGTTAVDCDAIGNCVGLAWE